MSEPSNKEIMAEVEQALGSQRLEVSEKNLITPEKLKSGGNYRVQVKTDEPGMIGFIISFLELYYPDLVEPTRDKHKAEIVLDYVEVMKTLARAGHGVQIRGHLQWAVPDRELRKKIDLDLERFGVPIQ